MKQAGHEARQNVETAPDDTAGWSAFLQDAGMSSHEILRAVVRMSPLPMVLTDPHRPDMPMIFCNRAFTNLTGYSQAECIGRNCRFLQGSGTDRASIRQLSEGIARREEVQVDLWNYRKDGSRFWNTMFVGPVFGRDGNLLYYFGSQVDATSRRELDEAKSQTRRMDTLGLMAAGIAHEVNNLMTVVVGNVEGLGSSAADARQTERLARISWAARATGKLTQQMLSFSSRQGSQAETVDLNDVLRDLEHLLTQVATAKTRFEVRLTDTGLSASVDLGQLELALLNLVRNASDASRHGGRIVAATGFRQENGVALVEISVTDEGTGMSPEVAAKVTEPFFTTKQHGSGTGLGLSMVSGFCQQSGGRMIVETEPGRGTTMRLVFPRV